MSHDSSYPDWDSNLDDFDAADFARKLLDSPPTGAHSLSTQLIRHTPVERPPRLQNNQPHDSNFQSQSQQLQLQQQSSPLPQPSLQSQTNQLQPHHHQLHHHQLALPPSTAVMDTYPDDGAIQAMAIAAKTSAEVAAKKRKKPAQILPFIQRLCRFVENPDNTEYIHWSEDGKAVVIPDDKVFEKNLLPTVFKHSNFSSFVRQLNMYGFHKVVGLEDNSMKSAEGKRKPPHRYENTYFRRGRPDWVWLIRKSETKKVSTGSIEKRYKDDDEEDLEDDETTLHAAAAAAAAAATTTTTTTTTTTATATFNTTSAIVPSITTAYGPTSEPSSAHASNVASASKELVAIPKKDWDEIRQLTVGLQKDNDLLRHAIKEIRQEHKDAQGRLQLTHDRQQKSINAIMTFLASIYRQQVQVGGSKQLAAILHGLQQGLGQTPHPHPHAHPHAHAATNNSAMVDINNRSDFKDMNLNLNLTYPPRGRINKPPLALLPAPELNNQIDANAYLGAPNDGRAGFFGLPPDRSSSIEPDNLNGISSTLLAQQLFNHVSPVASTIESLDSSSAANVLNPIDSHHQFNLETMLNLQPPSPAAGPVVQAETKTAQQNFYHAVAASGSSTQPSSNLIQPSRKRSLSPANQQLIDMIPPSMDRLGTAPSVDEILKFQQDYERKVQDLADKLGPLTPDGTVPGITVEDLGLPPNETWDLNNWLNNFEEYPENGPEMPGLSNSNLDLGNTDLNFNTNSEVAVVDRVLASNPRFTSDNKTVMSDRVESVSSRGVSPAAASALEEEERHATSLNTDAPRKRVKI